PMLVEHFRRRVAGEIGREIAGPSQGVLDILAAAPWPGNVRQLEQVVRRLAIDTGALTDADAAAAALRALETRTAERPRAEENEEREENADTLVSLDEAERRHIVAVLKATGGNQTQAAFILGIERKTLARKIRRLEIDLDS
ncbi:MAG TPA: helix-turn-helix domain-containing protein, partial [Thermoanaerobaculia bacterium]|nr:helix-turn-helix domain-containing protein [Thermoanaerobaculia bacterium]